MLCGSVALVNDNTWDIFALNGATVKMKQAEKKKD